MKEENNFNSYILRLFESVVSDTINTRCRLQKSSFERNIILSDYPFIATSPVSSLFTGEY